MKVYRGWADERKHETYVTVTEDGKTKPLPFYHEVYNHSPTGFSWGYGGSGPAQLALAILCDYFIEVAPAAPKSVALIYYQDFKWKVVAQWPQNEPFYITSDDIAAVIGGA